MPRSGTERVYRGGSWRTDFGASGGGMSMFGGIGWMGGGMAAGDTGDVRGKVGGSDKDEAPLSTCGHALPDHRSDDLGFCVCRSLELGSEPGEGPTPAVEAQRRKESEARAPRP